jgi:hypothetical protein
MAQQDLADLLTIFPSFASAQAMQQVLSGLV